MQSDIVARLRAVLHNDRSVELMNREAADEIERLRTERDDARRELCMVISGKGGKSAFVSGDAVDEAKRRGWDCYGVTNGQHLRTSVAESSQEAP